MCVCVCVCKITGWLILLTSDTDTFEESFLAHGPGLQSVGSKFSMHQRDSSSYHLAVSRLFSRFGGKQPEKRSKIPTKAACHKLSDLTLHNIPSETQVIYFTLHNIPSEIAVHL